MTCQCGAKPKRKRAPRETPEIAQGLRRQVESLGRRVGDTGDPVDLLEIVRVQEAAEAALRDAVARQRAEGFSWSMIADGLGVSKAAVIQRFGQRATA